MATVSSGGVRISYDVAGSGPPVLLLGGFAADRTFWAGVVPSLADHRTVVAVDNRGAGRSDAPDMAYTVADMAADVRAAMADASLTTPVDVVGHSMGGAIALTLALESPTLVRRMVLLQSFARLGLTARLALRAAGAAYDDDPEPMAELAGMLFPWLFSPQFLADADVRAEMVRLSVQNPTPQPRAGYDRQLAALDAFDAVDRLGELQVPTLVVAADADLIVPAPDSVLLATGIPGAHLVTVAGAGHCAPVERPDLVAALLRGFLHG